MTAHHKVLAAVTVLYVVLFFLHVVYLAFRKEKILSFIWVFMYVVFGLHTVGILLRWWESYKLEIGHAPLTNFYESLIVYAWCITGLMIVMRRKLAHPTVTGLASIVSFVIMGLASLRPLTQRNIEPLLPALQSNWLHIHVLTCFIAYAAFAVSFIAGFLYLIGPKWIIPSRENLEEMNYKCIIIGFPMLTSGILTGAVWAHYAWGSYWSWDPKETWSLITWIVYAVFLHMRLTRAWKGKALAVMSIIGFASVIVTYVVVNFLLSGLHSYGR